MTGRNGTIQSPEFPEQYLPRSYCEWVISTPLRTIIKLDWVSFNIRNSFECHEDWVEIYDNSTSKPQKILDKLVYLVVLI